MQRNTTDIKKKGYIISKNNMIFYIIIQIRFEALLCRLCFNSQCLRMLQLAKIMLYIAYNIYFAYFAYFERYILTHKVNVISKRPLKTFSHL